MLQPGQSMLDHDAQAQDLAPLRGLGEAFPFPTVVEIPRHAERSSSRLGTSALAGTTTADLR